MTRTAVQISGLVVGLVVGWGVAGEVALWSDSVLLAWVVAVTLWVLTVRAVYLASRGGQRIWPPYVGLLCGLTVSAAACAALFTFVSSLKFGDVT